MRYSSQAFHSFWRVVSRRLRRHRHVHLAHPVQLPYERLGLSFEFRLHRTRRCGEFNRKKHSPCGVIYRQCLDEPAVDDILAEVRVDDSAQLFEHLRLARPIGGGINCGQTRGITICDDSVVRGGMTRGDASSSGDGAGFIHSRGAASARARARRCRSSTTRARRRRDGGHDECVLRACASRGRGGENSRARDSEEVEERSRRVAVQYVIVFTFTIKL